MNLLPLKQQTTRYEKAKKKYVEYKLLFRKKKGKEDLIYIVEYKKNVAKKTQILELKAVLCTIKKLQIKCKLL